MVPLLELWEKRVKGQEEPINTVVLEKKLTLLSELWVCTAHHFQENLKNDFYSTYLCKMDWKFEDVSLEKYI